MTSAPESTYTGGAGPIGVIGDAAVRAAGAGGAGSCFLAALAAIVPGGREALLRGCERVRYGSKVRFGDGGRERVFFFPFLVIPPMNPAGRALL